MTHNSRFVSKLREFSAHDGDVQCIRIGRKSGQIMATGGDDCLLKIWHMGNPDPIMSLEGHSSPVTCIVFDSAEEHVVAGSERGSLKLWDLEKQKVVRSFNTGHLSSISCVDFHPFGDYFVSGSIDTNSRVWDVRRKSCVQAYKGHASPVHSCRFTPDGRWLVTGDERGIVKLWDLTQGKKLQDFVQHDGAISCLDFHPSEFLLATGSRDKTVKFWDLDQFQLISSTDIDTGGIRSIAFTEGGEALLSGSADNMKIWSWEPECSCLDIADTRWGGLGDMFVNSSLNRLFAASYEKDSVSLWVLALDQLNPWRSSQREPIQYHHPLQQPQQQQQQDSYAHGRLPSPQHPPLPHVNKDVHAPDYRTEDVMTELNNSFNRSRNERVADGVLRTSRPSSSSSDTAPKTVHVSVGQLQTRQPTPPDHRDSKPQASKVPGNSEMLPPAPRPQSGGDRGVTVDIVVPAKRDKPANLDPSAFHPAKYEKDVMALTDAEIMQELMEPHAQVISVINSRLNNLKIVRRLWSVGETKEAVDNIVKISDAAIAVDFLKQIIKPENVRLLTLDMCVALLPLQSGLLSSKFEDHIVTSLNTVNLLYRSFSPLIQTTLQTSHQTGHGVDLSKEARIDKCKFCFQRFVDLQSLVDKRFSHHSGEIGDAARQLLTTMGRPASATASTRSIEGSYGRK